VARAILSSDLRPRGAILSYSLRGARPYRALLYEAARAISIPILRDRKGHSEFH
ncbi:hypothetical protein HAX54_039901, partial [Datura stramonium]|nr:hypothetical protein [Datura stramonium]